MSIRAVREEIREAKKVTTGRDHRDHVVPRLSF